MVWKFSLCLQLLYKFILELVFDVLFIFHCLLRSKDYCVSPLSTEIHYVPQLIPNTRPLVGV